MPEEATPQPTPTDILVGKYATRFHFYRVRPINEILFGEGERTEAIQLMDMRVFIYGMNGVHLK